MQTEFSKEQNLLRDVVSRALRDKSPATAVRELMATDRGYDPAVWQELCGDAGLAGVHVPEVHGGAGGGAVELGIVAEEMGRTLFCGPWFASAVMAGTALLEAANESDREELLPGVADGSTIATLVLDDLDDPAGVGGSITATANGTLTGVASMAVDAHVADLLLVVASGTGVLGLHAVEGGASGLAIEPLQVVDPTRKLSRVAFTGVPGRHIGEVTGDTLNRIWDRICSALAHEMMGGAQHLFETTVSYTKERFQFGRPIGSFQALKHRCADLLLEIEIARALTHHSARCLDSGEGEPCAASMAKAAAADAYMSAARAGIQLRGGIGFTWENDTHLWFKRSKGSEVLFGTPAIHRERMMTMLEGAA
ncbi:MAG: acyl-CoA/acyl-ACP dehydrogenase [Acidobacteria bacterium]|nr:acyl-CoA/acyl-ACP dehydrogenase [Acidobacteriota bacterium]MCY3930107.1 acyl-CoA/acyl-ACP dehydrogenase [Acidobacteriota bacterium]